MRLHDPLLSVIVKLHGSRVFQHSHGIPLIAMPATVHSGHLELGVKHAVAIRPPSCGIVDEQAQDGVSALLIDVRLADWLAVREVLTPPPARLSVPADSIEGAALIRTKVSP